MSKHLAISRQTYYTNYKQHIISNEDLSYDINAIYIYAGMEVYHEVMIC